MFKFFHYLYHILSLMGIDLGLTVKIGSHWGHKSVPLRPYSTWGPNLDLIGTLGPKIHEIQTWAPIWALGAQNLALRLGSQGAQAWAPSRKKKVEVFCCYMLNKRKKSVE